MRILVVTDQWSPDILGGSARVATDTARLLAERGHDVRLVSPRAQGRPERERVEGVDLHRALRRTPLPQTFADPVDAFRALRPQHGWPDVVLAHQATVATGAVAARVGAPLALVFHASAALEQRFLRQRLSPSRRLAKLALHPSLELLERVAVSRAASILVLSEFSRRLVLDRHPRAAGRVVLVRGGVDAAAFAPRDDGPAVRARLGVPHDRPFLLSVRRLEPRMGLEELLRAARLLLDRGVPVTVGIAGAGRLDGALRRLAGELGLERETLFFGRVPDAELPGLYAAADLFVLPTVAYEGFGMVTLEALASGTPVVGTPVGATPELLRPLDPNLLARSAAPDDLADAVQAALGRTEGAPPAPARSRCARYAAERFDWRAAIVDWEAALARAAGLDGGPGVSPTGGPDSDRGGR